MIPTCRPNIENRAQGVEAWTTQSQGCACEATVPAQNPLGPVSTAIPVSLCPALAECLWHLDILSHGSGQNKPRKLSITCLPCVAKMPAPLILAEHLQPSKAHETLWISFQPGSTPLLPGGIEHSLLSSQERDHSSFKEALARQKAGKEPGKGSLK